MKTARLMARTVLAVLPVLFCTNPAHAIDVAVPGDFPAYESTDNDPSNTGYYFSACRSVTPEPVKNKPYAFLMDPHGHIAWFLTDYTRDIMFPHYSNDQMMVCVKHDNINGERELIVYSPGFEVERVIPRYNPYRPTMKMDMHEARIDDDGSIYTLWYDPVVVDMSQYVQGGDPNALVKHSTIQQWDLDGNLLWEWRSLDHVDQLPYTARTNYPSIFDSSFEHLHLNSFQVLADGDLVINALGINYTFRIDRDSGNVIWGIGGQLNQFDFTTDLDLPPEVELDFFPAHDATYFLDGRLTLFDNGKRHDVPRAAGREYVLDFDTMTAELIWYYEHPDEIVSQSQGSTRIVESDKRVIGWGGGAPTEPTVTATEVTNFGFIVWEVVMHDNPDGTGEPPATYRWYKLNSFEPAVQPYLSEVSYLETNTIELVCNWFGHEDEVDGYAIYAGLNENNLQLQGYSWDGFYYLEGVDPLETYYCRMVPVDINETPVGPESNLLDVQVAATDLVLDPVVQIVPATGGTISYNATFTSTYETQQQFQLVTEAILPSGFTYGPLLSVYFQMQPNSVRTVEGLTLAVPAYAPSGEYTFVGRVIEPGFGPISEDRFRFGKESDGSDATTYTGPFIPEDWPTGGDLSSLTGVQIPASSTAKEAIQPKGYRLNRIWPNPFNASTTITVTLPESAELTVTVYNITGQEVVRLADGFTHAGRHEFNFDASHLASGLYFVRATVSGKLNQTRKMMLVR